MKATTHSQSIWHWLLALLFAGIAVFLTLRSTSLYGPGVSSDSVNYLRLARDISEGGLAILTEWRAIQQPPFYPTILSVLSRILRADLLEVARWLNIVTFASLVFTIFLSLKRVTAFIPALIATGTLACFSIPLSHVSSMVWTEPLVILLTSILFLIVTGSKRTAAAALFAGLLAASACLTRYVGIVLIPVVSAFIFLAWPGRFSRRLKCGVAYAFGSLLLLSLYVARNYVISGTLFGMRYPSKTGVLANVELAGATLFAWFAPNGARPLVIVMLGLLLLLVVIACFYRGCLLRVIRGSHAIAPLWVAFGIAHLVFILWTSTTIAYDPMDDRLLSPIYPSLLIVFALCLRPELWGGRKRAILAASGFCLLFVVSPLRAVIADFNARAMHGAGKYSTREWQESQLVAHFKEIGQPSGELLFSNAPDVLYILADVTASWSPPKRWYNSSATTGITAANLFERYPGLDGALLVWCDRRARDYLFTPDELQKMCTLSVISDFEDGTVYRVERGLRGSRDSM